MELENIILREVSQAQKAKKITCSPSHVDYRSKTNAVILLDMGHTLTGVHAWEGGKGQETQNLNMVDVLTIQELRK
jgi:hypothetical protein